MRRVAKLLFIVTLIMLITIGCDKGEKMAPGHLIKDQDRIIDAVA